MLGLGTPTAANSVRDGMKEMELLEREVVAVAPQLTDLPERVVGCLLPFYALYFCPDTPPALMIALVQTFITRFVAWTSFLVFASSDCFAALLLLLPSSAGNRTLAPLRQLVTTVYK